MTKDERELIKEVGGFGVRLLAQRQHRHFKKDITLAEDATDLTREQIKQWAYSDVIFAILADLVNGDNGESVIDRDKRKE